MLLQFVLLSAIGLLCLAALGATVLDVARDGYRRHRAESSYGAPESTIADRIRA
ncbi:hypothetical protein [Microbacterium stercoris]|uniref:Uncharacterized protein n=1 Tax=Microbacterium stercoris TaxID=2820289 RepID=A0A939TUH3_9MICO|nr:hypothetical protein [Microbacterium stercoris]MBO3664034.1 hypothetical protein [Microbacterium stercoris]